MKISHSVNMNRNTTRAERLKSVNRSDRENALLALSLAKRLQDIEQLDIALSRIRQFPRLYYVCR